MATSNILGFSEPFERMTFADGLAFIDRTRRQLDRFETALPHETGSTIDPEESESIRRICDKVEADLHRMLGGTI